MGILLNVQAQMPDNILQIDLLQTSVWSHLAELCCHLLLRSRKNILYVDSFFSSTWVILRAAFKCVIYRAKSIWIHFHPLENSKIARPWMMITSFALSDTIPAEQCSLNTKNSDQILRFLVTLDVDGLLYRIGLDTRWY